MGKSIKPLYGAGVDKSSFIGKTLRTAARKCGFSREGYRVYLLREQNDQDGVLAARDYELCRIGREHPKLGGCVIVHYEEYYGIRIFRVREKTWAEGHYG